MKEFKIKISKHKYIFTKLFTVLVLVFITSSTFIYTASAQAVVSNVYAEKESDAVIMKRELVNLCQQISEKGMPKDTQAMFKWYKIEIDCSDKQNPLPKVNGKAYSYEEFTKFMQEAKKDRLTYSDFERISGISPLTTQDYTSMLKQSMDWTIKNRNIVDTEAYSKIFSLNKTEWTKVLNAEKNKDMISSGKVLNLEDSKYCIKVGHDDNDTKQLPEGSMAYDYIGFICDYSNDTVLVYKVELRSLSMSISLSATGTGSGSSSSRFITKEEFFKEYKLNKNETVVPSEPIKVTDPIPAKVVFEKPLKLGSKGSQVKYIQNILKDNGYLKTVTGVYDKDTVLAVKRFQKDTRLVVTGIVGKITFNKLSPAR